MSFEAVNKDENDNLVVPGVPVECKEGSNSFLVVPAMAMKAGRKQNEQS